MESKNELPPNVGAAVHPKNKNYIMFTTFDGTNPTEVDTLDLPAYKEALKTLVTVMEYEYFQALIESVEGDVAQAGKMFYLPQTIRKLKDLPEGFGDMIAEFCEDFGENTMAIVRFFEFDKENDSYNPVDVQFGDSGELLQAEGDEEE